MLPRSSVNVPSRAPKKIWAGAARLLTTPRMMIYDDKRSGFRSFVTSNRRTRKPDSTTDRRRHFRDRDDCRLTADHRKRTVT